jgi:hypothetical protein
MRFQRLEVRFAILHLVPGNALSPTIAHSACYRAATARLLKLP